MARSTGRWEGRADGEHADGPPCGAQRQLDRRAVGRAQDPHRGDGVRRVTGHCPQRPRTVAADRDGVVVAVAQDGAEQAQLGHDQVEGLGRAGFPVVGEQLGDARGEQGVEHVRSVASHAVPPLRGVCGHTCGEPTGTPSALRAPDVSENLPSGPR